MADERFFVLGPDGEPVSASPQEWGAFFQDRPRRVGYDVIGETIVSTVFLGMNHQFLDGPPILFETMVFGGPLGEEQVRYSTTEEAISGHAAMCERVRTAQRLLGQS